MKNLLLKIKKEYKNTNKLIATIHILLRIFVIISIIISAINRNWYNVFCLSVVAIGFMLPYFFKNTFKVEIPSALELVIVLFIFASIFLGEMNSFYEKVPNYDTYLHLINGFISCAIGYSIGNILNINYKSFQLNRIFNVIFAICFTTTIGVLWEFMEFGFDNSHFRTDMQKDRIITNISSVDLNKEKINKAIKINDIYETVIYYDEDKKLTIQNGYLDIGLYDTMKDLKMNFIGSLVFAFALILNKKDSKKYKVANEFIIKKEKTT